VALFDRAHTTDLWPFPGPDSYMLLYLGLSIHSWTMHRLWYTYN